MAKKVTCILMALLLVAATLTGVMLAAYGEKTVQANKLLLQNILEKRPWVIETLVDGDYTDNPYNQVCAGATREGFMESVLQNYKESTAFKVLVDSMEAYSNAGQYVTNWTEEVVASLLEFFNLTDALSLEKYVDESVKTVDALRYEDIINDVLTEDYTASWGATLLEADSEMEQYRQMSKILKNLSGYQKALKDNNELLASGFFESSEDFMDYTDNFLSAYEDTLYDALVNIPAFSGAANHEALTKKLLGASALAFVLGAETYNPLKTSSSSAAYQGSLMAEKYNEYFAGEIGALLKGTGKVLNFSSNATKYAMIANAVAAQTDTTAQVLERIRTTSANEDIQQTMQHYKNLVEDQGKTDALAIDAVLDYLSGQDSVGKAVLKQGGKLFTNVVNLRHGYFDGNKMVMTNALCENLIKAGKCVAIAVWVADKATNIQDTAKKIYICKYTDKLIKETVKTYKADYRAYQSDQTDENAKKVLDDLEFLKKLRLYGEKQGYSSVCSQTESIVGLLLGGDSVKDGIEKNYQGMVDSLLGCTMVPGSNNAITVGEGETLILFPTRLHDGSITLQANYSKKDKSHVFLPEADLIFMNGLTLNGGTVEILNSAALSQNPAVFINRLRASGDSELTLRGSELVIGEINNAGNLQITYSDENTSLHVSSAFNNQGSVAIDAQGAHLKVQELSNSGTVAVNSGTVDVYGNITSSSGTYSGALNVCGDGSRDYENTYMDIAVQSLSGTGTFEKLYFNNAAREGVRIGGTQTLTGLLADSGSRLRTPQNLCLTGQCALADNRSKNALSFKDYTSTAPLRIGGTAFIKGNVSFGGETAFEDGLYLTGNCNTLTLGAPAKVKGDFKYAAGSIEGDGFLTLCGDAEISASQANIAKLNFAGLTAQTVSGANALTVAELDNHNLSLSGVDFTSKINVTSLLCSGSTSNYKNAKNITLVGDAKLNGNTVRGSISVKDWSCSENCTVKGTLYASGDICIKSPCTLETVNYIQSGGSLTIEAGAALHCTGDFAQAGTTQNAGTVQVEGDSKVSAAFTGGTLKAKGDINASAALQPDVLHFAAKTEQTFNNTAATEVKTLLLENSSLSGITLSSTIKVTERYENNSKKVINGANIALADGAQGHGTQSAVSDLTVTNNYTLKSGETLTVNGKLYLNSGANLRVESGANLLVRRSLIATAAAITVEAGGSLQIDDYFSSSSTTVAAAGTLLIKGDAKITSSTVSGTGLLTFKGDVSISGGTWNRPNVAFVSKVPQSVGGTSISVNDLTVENTSKTGITFTDTVGYYGELAQNSTSVSGENYLVKKN